MRIRSLDVGVEAISRFHVEDDVHLPDDKGLRPAFLPLSRPLDDVLKRPSLDERLPQLLQPDYLDTDLLEPATLADVRLQTRRVLGKHARRETGSRRQALELATAYLDDAALLDDEVRRSLAALLRG
jgi:Type III secretion system YscX (type_III_YscX)